MCEAEQSEWEMLSNTSLSSKVPSESAVTPIVDELESRPSGVLREETISGPAAELGPCLECLIRGDCATESEGEGGEEVGELGELEEAEDEEDEEEGTATDDEQDESQATSERIKIESSIAVDLETETSCTAEAKSLEDNVSTTASQGSQHDDLEQGGGEKGKEVGSPSSESDVLPINGLYRLFPPAVIPAKVRPKAWGLFKPCSCTDGLKGGTATEFQYCLRALTKVVENPDMAKDPEFLQGLHAQMGFSAHYGDHGEDTYCQDFHAALRELREQCKRAYELYSPSLSSDSDSDGDDEGTAKEGSIRRKFNSILETAKNSAAYEQFECLQRKVQKKYKKKMLERKKRVEREKSDRQSLEPGKKVDPFKKAKEVMVNRFGKGSA